MLSMRKCLLYIESIILAGCSVQNTIVETKNTFHETSCIDWGDKKHKHGAKQYYNYFINKTKAVVLAYKTQQTVPFTII